MPATIPEARLTSASFQSKIVSVTSIQSPLILIVAFFKISYFLKIVGLLIKTCKKYKNSILRGSPSKAKTRYTGCTCESLISVQEIVSGMWYVVYKNAKMPMSRGFSGGNPARDHVWCSDDLS